MPWIYLALAGILEVVWAVGLKRTEGFTKPAASAITVAAIVVSLWLLGLATRTLPIGTAYAVWVGIGVLGTAVLGVVWLGEPISFARVAFLALLLVAVVGLKLTGETAAGH